MEFKILNFPKTEKTLRNKYSAGLLTTADYWTWYTTGVESIVNEQDFVLTDRYDNERTDVLAYNFYESESTADVLVLINNDNFLWDAPADFDLMWDITDNKMEYLLTLNKLPFEESEYNYWREKMSTKTEKTHDIQSEIVIPNRNTLQKTIRKINEYLEEREVK
jgi:hypothetical protein